MEVIEARLKFMQTAKPFVNIRFLPFHVESILHLFICDYQINHFTDVDDNAYMQKFNEVKIMVEDVIIVTKFTRKPLARF